jgi:hypothetical protein
MLRRTMSSDEAGQRFDYTEFDLSDVHTYPIGSRTAKTHVDQFAKPFRGAGVLGWLETLPSLLAGADIKEVVHRLADARRSRRGIVWGFGAHVVKTGLAPVLIDLMERGYVSALATNGAGIIHDFEIALAGSTSEDVEQQLGQGRFGMADETGRVLNHAISEGVNAGQGLGEAVANYIRAMQPPYEGLSIAAAAARLGIPLTVHVALGTDVIHMHASASGAALGEGSLRDFRRFVGNVARLEGGVYLNCGSAVILPEVFLKAVALARNKGISLSGLMTINIDFVRLYRPETNVVARPTAGVGRGYSLVGHHEILIPLIAAALSEQDR